MSDSATLFIVAAFVKPQPRTATASGMPLSCLEAQSHANLAKQRIRFSSLDG